MPTFSANFGQISGYPVDMKAGLSHARLLIGALLLLVAILIGTAWQASRSVAEHRATAVAVLEDYAELAVDEFTRRAIVQVGYYGFYPVMTRLKAMAEADVGAMVDLAEGYTKAAVPPAEKFFVFDIEKYEFVAMTSSLTGRFNTPQIRDFVRYSLLPLTQSGLPESGFVTTHAKIEDKWVMFVVGWTDDRRLLYGFSVSRTWLGETLQQVVDDGPLLPASLADGAVTNDLVFLQFERPESLADRQVADGIANLDSEILASGTEVVVLRAGDDNYYPTTTSLRSFNRTSTSVFHAGAFTTDGITADRVLADEYDGLFRDFTVRATIDRGLADDLIIGGLPGTRLPLIGFMIVLAVVLLIAAVYQFRREAAVAEMRTNFVAEVSHELRTPLTQISMFTESLLLDRMRSGEDRDRALSIIQRESSRLTHLVDNILRFSGNGQTEIPFRPQQQALAPIVSEIVMAFEAIAAASDASIEAHLDPAIEAPVDADALRQILINLLDNAIKYGPKGQTVRVALSAGEDRIRIEVDDEGPGVPESARERIWSDFIRLERDRERATTGTGIGLAVVAELAARHGGKAHVEDGDRGGARFVIEIPS